MQKLFILQHGILEAAKRNESDRGGNFYLRFSDGNTAALSGFGWAGYLRILDFIGSEISRVVGSRGEIIYEDSIEIGKWEGFYKKWRNTGELPCQYNDETMGGLANYTTGQIFQREIQKALSESLLKAYRIRVE